MAALVQRRVRSGRWWLALSKSWAKVLLGAGVLAAVLGGAFMLVAALLPGAVGFFRWAFVLSALLVLLLTVFNEPLVALALGARRIRSREDHPRLWDSVVRVSGGLLVTPRIYLVPERGMNALCFGIGLPWLSAVGATSGLLARLDDGQLDAVMAHEVGHVSNKDILISMAAMFFVTTITLAGSFMRDHWEFGAMPLPDKKDGKSRLWHVLLAAILLPLMGHALYWFGKAIGPVISAFISRAREYGADAYSAKTLGRSGPLEEALTIVMADPSIGRGSAAKLVGFLCTVDPYGDELLSTHPSLENRIRALRALEE
jgi:heat shock protein HtpX